MLVEGDKSLLGEKLAVILNSSQSKTPCGNDSWVARTAAAARRIIDSGFVMITSTGIVTWELLVHLAAATSGRQVILCPVTGEGLEKELFDITVADFGLDPNKCAMLFVGSPLRGRSPKKNWPGRDGQAVAMAQKIYPISIRPGGRLDTMIKSNADSGKIDDRFHIEYAPAVYRPTHYDISGIKLDVENWDFITHWTKTRHGPWPGETRSAFYGRLLASDNRYPNSAFDTLINIVRERKIRASSDKIRDSFPAIGFSECPPIDILKMLRWCPRRVNWNFEPYGIAVKRPVAEKMGAKPVIYGIDEDYRKFSESAKPFFQNRGGKAVDWRGEREWRHIGDFDFNQVPDDKIMFYVWRRIEADYLRKLTSCPVMSFEGD
ncbi:MAG: hypothetical protein A2W25_03855 [candidate division Zixibacteria bacterium RBG_16_53_22]|nr:MAG: hypothetical protein A2W25_03855 [candidate division Zixibacteria bacterium RBG_16_53_22]